MVYFFVELDGCHTSDLTESWRGASSPLKQSILIWNPSFSLFYMYSDSQDLPLWHKNSLCPLFRKGEDRDLKKKWFKEKKVWFDVWTHYQEGRDSDCGKVKWGPHTLIVIGEHNRSAPSMFVFLSNKHPAAVLSILSSVRPSFTKQNDAQGERRKRSREEKQVQQDVKLVLRLSKNAAFYSFMSKHKESLIKLLLTALFFGSYHTWQKLLFVAWGQFEPNTVALL